MTGVFGPERNQSPCRLRDLDVMVLQQISCRVVQPSYGNLKISLSLNKIQFRLGELSLGVENKKDGLGAQFVFSFICMEAFPGKIHSDFGCFHGEFGLLECVHRIRNLQRDVLIGAALLVLIAAPADDGIGEVGFGVVVFYGETQRKDSAVSRVGKMKRLAEAIAKAGLNYKLVAGDAVASVKAGKFEVRF